MIESPCVASFKLDNAKVCLGCFRHITEIVDWNRKTQPELAGIMQKVQLRKQQYQQQDLTTLATSPISQAEWLAVKHARSN